MTRHDDVGVHILQSRYPEGYARWILIGVLVTLLGYGATCIGLWQEKGLSQLWRWSDVWVFLLSLLALRLWFERRLRAAGSVVLTAVVLELHFSFMFGHVQSWAPTGMMVPMTVSIAALWLGPRIAQWLGWIILFSVPAAIGFSGWYGSTQGFATPGFPYLVIVLVVTVLTSNTLLITFMEWLADSLQRSETEELRMRELLAAAPDGVVVLGPDRCIEMLNTEAGRILGAPPVSLEGRPIDELLDWRDGFDLTGWLSALPRSTESVDMLGGPHGIPLEVRASRFSRHEGDEGTVLLMRDITQRRETEDRERALQKQLLQAQKMEAVGLLAGGVAHDFNNLITVIGGYGAMLTRSTDPEARRFAPDIMAVQERAAALVRHLLTFARRETVQPLPMDLASCVQEATSLLSRMLGERVELVMHTSEPCPILADPGQMEQVLINLAVNARDAMPDGGRLVVRCRAGADRVTLEVEDQGTGIPEDQVERIFEPFFTTKPPDEGTGLGLSTVHGIVTKVGGEVTVDSVVGRGTRFVVSIPRTLLPLEEKAVPVMVELETATKGISVLVAEDNDAVRSYLERLLRRAGFVVQMARSGDQAVELLMQASRPPDLFLSDVVMAGLTGPEAAEMARKRWPNLRCLFMSGYLGVSSEAELFDTTSNLIMKPFGAGELLRRIEIILGQPAGPAKSGP